MLLLGALNRSPFADTAYLPKSGKYAGQAILVVSAIRESYPEYRQDDPEVAADIALGKIEWEVKKNWPNLIRAMDLHNTTN